MKTLLATEAWPAWILAQGRDLCIFKGIGEPVLDAASSRKSHSTLQYMNTIIYKPSPVSAWCYGGPQVSDNGPKPVKADRTGQDDSPRMNVIDEEAAPS